MQVETLILGAGAAGMMAAAHAGPGVLVVDHAKAPGEKIRISGGGRCNFTNMHCDAQAFLGGNPHFHKSALARYTQWDFLDLVGQHGIAWHEKTLGQLFCDDKATQIVAMLRAQMDKAGAALWLKTEVKGLRHADGLFHVALDREGRRESVVARNLVVATGGKSIPKMGATGLAYDIARQFDHAVTETRPALVPLTFDNARFASISGVSLPVRAFVPGASFDEALLFTHRGLSGPAILQISSYWREGEEIGLDLLPGLDLAAHLKAARSGNGRRALTTELGAVLPARLVGLLGADMDLTGNLADLSDKRIAALAETLKDWRQKPSGSEGYRTAEVTLGGVATDKVSSSSMMSQQVAGLYFIGEALDVTGWLGGYNFQWAWSSAVAAGRNIANGGR
ncbi:BaiN/RdsA family NAD(P)/FAD-dependent oxidoreductase [Tropicibacter oceani]|uniref:Aminoacetone oxidase family FAD-binding enzyme n=1 Tax=Tropicibacter oceani TaxID=3058420 RepID=A0ABY8QCD0_9RHOB|nr:aminoacetone oxidase family FAD-binding enzyme [Tropicibacter oceani]WGW02270.1 aminoacetone oxidase family FAD-binding enzyme [Tropicibacter oceani]